MVVEEIVVVVELYERMDVGGGGSGAGACLSGGGGGGGYLFVHFGHKIIP